MALPRRAAHALTSAFLASPASLNRLLDRFNTFAVAERLPSPVRRKAYLALDEIVSNVLTHGRTTHDAPPHTRRRRRISVVVTADARTLTLEVIDDGPAFDPTAAGPPRLSGGLNERQLGGLGIYLVQRLADTVEYRRRRGRNELRVTFRRAAAQKKL